MQKEKMWEYLNKNTELKDMLTREYIYNLVYGELSRMGTINEINKILGIRKIPNLIFLIMIDDFWDICINYDNKKRYAIKRSVLDIVRESIKDYDAIATSLIGTDKIIILFDLNYPIAEDQILDKANHIKEYIKNNTKYTATIGIGNIRDDYREIWRSYEESFLAINYSFSLGKDLVVQYKDLIKSDKNQTLSYDFLHYEYQVFKNLLNEDTKLVLIFYDNMFHSLINNGYRIETIKSIMNKFILNLSDHCSNLGLNSIFISTITIEASSKIITASSVATIKELGKAYLESISTHIINFTKGDVRLSLDATILFIEKFYYNEIPLSDVAHIANMSEGYFCRSFKKYYGVNFSNYVLDTRLRKSQELLLKTKLSIVEISDKVGFKNSSYFSTSFKNKYDCSPSHYRKMREG